MVGSIGRKAFSSDPATQQQWSLWLGVNSLWAAFSDSSKQCSMACILAVALALCTYVRDLQGMAFSFTVAIFLSFFLGMGTHSMVLLLSLPELHYLSTHIFAWQSSCSFLPFLAGLIGGCSSEPHNFKQSNPETTCPIMPHLVFLDWLLCHFLEGRGGGW